MKIEQENVLTIVNKYDGNRDSLISILQDVQTEYHFLPEDALRIVAKKIDVPLVQVYGVATFFKAFSLKPRGEHLITVCQGTACHVRRAPAVLDEIVRQIGIQPGETGEDLQFSLQTVNCLGACALGPIVVVDGIYHGQMSPGKVKKILKQLKKGQ